MQHRRKDGSIFPVESSHRRIQIGGATYHLAIVRDITERQRANTERERLIGDLQNALAEVKTLRGLLPICAGCKKIRDEKEQWHPVETYVMRHSEAQFTHGYCPECLRKYFPDISGEA
jgi:hypothetical protein